MGRKGYYGKRKEWELEDEKLAAEGKENPWEQYPGRSRPYLWARLGPTTSASRDITLTSPPVADVADKVKKLQLKLGMVLSLGLGRMMFLLRHLRIQSIEVGCEVSLVHLARVKGLAQNVLKCTGRRRRRGGLMQTRKK